MGKGQLAGIPNWHKKNVSSVDAKVAKLNTNSAYEIAADSWVANADSTLYPYKYVIADSKYNVNSMPIWQMWGADITSLPTEDEENDCNLVSKAYFDESGIILYATDQPTNNLSLIVKGV